MKFDLVDQVLEQEERRIVTIKQVTLAEEYLADHFPSFPILPGVLMLEAMVQAASKLLAPKGDRLVLGEVKAVKYGAMVRPGDTLRVEVIAGATTEDGTTPCKGTGTVLRGDSGETMKAVAGRFTMRSARFE
jgi:3-hydroxyacyl-[acyl-carrier-protein] dehydratase